MWENMKLAFFTISAPEVTIAVATGGLFAALKNSRQIIDGEFKNDNIP